VVVEVDEHAGELFGVVEDFPAEAGLLADEGGGGGEGDVVAIVVFGFAEAD
jgi:hypothetical protein